MRELLQSHRALVLLPFIVHHQLFLAGGEHATYLTVELGGRGRPAQEEQRYSTCVHA